MEGSVLDGKYQLVRHVGGGGMGNVYESVHIGTGRRVAVKVVKTRGDGSDDVLVKRFEREARAAGAIESRHIGQVLDIGRDATIGLPYMVMEFLNGEDLEALTRRTGGLPPLVALKIAAQACRGLAKAHAMGIVHRDIKPANLFLSVGEGDEVLVKVLDFGIAKMRADLAVSLESGGLTRTGSMVGSPIYMSPEQARGHKEVDERADLWSLGVVMFQTMTGRTPWDNIDHLGELILAICSSLPPMVQDYAPWVPKEAAAIVHRAISLDMEQRFQSADQMLSAIAPLLGDDFALHKSMLKPVEPAARSQVAPKLSAAPVPFGPPAPRSSISNESSGEGRGSLTRTVPVATPLPSPPGATQDGLATQATDARRGRKGILVGLVGAAVVGGLAALGLGMQRADGPAGPARGDPPEPPTTVADLVPTVTAGDSAPAPIVDPPPVASGEPSASASAAASVSPPILGGGPNVGLVKPPPVAPSSDPPPKDPGGLDTSGFGDRK